MLVFLLTAVLGLSGLDPAQDPATQEPGSARDAAAGPRAQAPDQSQRDEVTLRNGDVLRGKLVDFTGGNITFNTDDLGNLEIPLERIQNLSTAEPVVVVTERRSHVQGRIRSIVGGQLQMADDEGNFTAVPLEAWDAMRFPDGRAARWRGSLAVGGRVSRGNTEERRFNASLDFRRRSDIDRVIGSATFFYDEDFNDATNRYELDERRGNAILQYDYFLGPEAYAWGVGQWSEDSEAEVDRRLIFGAGGGYQFSETDSFHLEGLLGVTYYEKIYSTPEPTLSYPALRAGYNLDWEFLSGASLIQSLQALPSLENPDEDFYLRSDLRLRITFWEGLFTELLWIYEYDTAPAMGRERSDSVVSVNIGWSF